MNLTIWECCVEGHWRYVVAETAALASVVRPGSVRLVDRPCPRAPKFERGLRWRERSSSKQRLAAAKKALANERERAGLFGDQVAATQPTPEDRIAAIDSGLEQSHAEDRTRTAQQWRQARRTLRALPEAVRGPLLFRWNAGGWPKHAVYLLGMLRTATTKAEGRP